MQLIREFINFRIIKIVTGEETPRDFVVNGKLSTALFMHTSDEHFADVTVMNCKRLFVLRGFVQLQLELRVKNCITSVLGVLLEINSQGCTKSFDVRQSVHHRTIQINQPTRCNSFTSLLLDVYVCLNMFRAPLRPSSGTYNYTRSLRQNSVSVR